MAQPSSLAFGDNGNLYAADFAGLTPGIHEFDGATGAAVGQVLSLASPSSVRFGPDGNLYVASSTLDVVNVYDATGTFIRTHSDAADAVASPYLRPVTSVRDQMGKEPFSLDGD